MMVLRLEGSFTDVSLLETLKSLYLAPKCVSKSQRYSPFLRPVPLNISVHIPDLCGTCLHHNNCWTNQKARELLLIPLHHKLVSTFLHPKSFKAWTLYYCWEHLYMPVLLISNFLKSIFPAKTFEPIVMPSSSTFVHHSSVSWNFWADKLPFSPMAHWNRCLSTIFALQSSLCQHYWNPPSHKRLLSLFACQVPLNLQARVALRLIETVLHSTIIEPNAQVVRFPLLQSLLNSSASRSSSRRKSWNFDLTREALQKEGWHT